MKALWKLFGVMMLCMGIVLFLNPIAFANSHTKHKKKSHTHTASHPHSKHHSTHKTIAVETSAIYGTSNLVSAINSAIQNVDPNLNIGVAVKSMKYGDVLYTHNPHHPFVPASILKILTAEAALLYLGADYKFQTSIYTDASALSNGILRGNLYLVHSGDPTLTYYDLIELIDALKAQQITQIQGNIYVDTTAYDQVVYGPGWIGKDTRFCYGAPISASIINHNCLSLVSNILEYNKSLVRTLFNRSGIQLNGSVLAGALPQKLPVIATHQSKPLSTLITEMLKKSDNIIAGSLFKKIGETYSQQPGSWENGSMAVSHILAQKAKVNTTGMNVLDGSGLSRYNQVTPSQMLQILDFAYHDTVTNYEFISGLPVAGVDGTLKNRLHNIAWKVRAKTGTMSGVNSLAGFAVTRDKEPLAFVIIVNGRLGLGWRYKALEDRIVTTLTRYSRESE